MRHVNRTKMRGSRVRWTSFGFIVAAGVQCIIRSADLYTSGSSSLICFSNIVENSK
jgi:hypothetical protein